VQVPRERGRVAQAPFGSEGDGNPPALGAGHTRFDSEVPDDPGSPRRCPAIARRSRPA
jgi:hypothetical protein